MFISVNNLAGADFPSLFTDMNNLVPVKLTAFRKLSGCSTSTND
jgi:hypothetical protein